MGCTCNSHAPQRLTINQVLRTDPTRTLTLRNRFARDASARLRRLKRDITATIVTNDAFGLTNSPVLVLEAAPPNAFNFPRSADKVTAFMAWLQRQHASGLLEVVQRPGVTIGSEPWSNTYIRSAYQKGMERARIELRKAGYDVPAFSDTGGSFSAMMNQPFHADRVALAYTRTFIGLEGITSAMDTQISRVLADGLASGASPLDIARAINDRVDKIGITRARTLARTEVIRAHHHANINEYRQWGLTGVRVQAEWSTAGFGVCELCRPLEGRVFDLDVIYNMLPRHPNCRCVAIPVPIGRPVRQRRRRRVPV